MPEFIRRHDGQHTHSGWTVSILLGIMVACLLGFIASYAKEALRVSNTAQAQAAGPATLASKPVLATKKPVRYEAIIANWKRYRSATKPDE